MAVEIKNFRKLIPTLKVAIAPTRVRLMNRDGPEGRLNIIGKVITDLIKNERVEVNYHRGHEARNYCERLISEAIRYGDTHKPTMELANFYIHEKQYVHKLFKVIVPRLRDIKKSYTILHIAPRKVVHERTEHVDRVVLELRNNPLPKIQVFEKPNKNWLHNILLFEAKKEYKQERLSKEVNSHIQSSNLEDTEPSNEFIPEREPKSDDV